MASQSNNQKQRIKDYWSAIFRDPEWRRLLHEESEAAKVEWRFWMRAFIQNPANPPPHPAWPRGFRPGAPAPTPSLVGGTAARLHAGPSNDTRPQNPPASAPSQRAGPGGTPVSSSNDTRPQNVSPTVSSRAAVPDATSASTSNAATQPQKKEPPPAPTGPSTTSPSRGKSRAREPSPVEAGPSRPRDPPLSPEQKLEVMRDLQVKLNELEFGKQSPPSVTAFFEEVHACIREVVGWR